MVHECTCTLCIYEAKGTLHTHNVVHRHTRTNLPFLAVAHVRITGTPGGSASPQLHALQGQCDGSPPDTFGPFSSPLLPLQAQQCIVVGDSTLFEVLADSPAIASAGVDGSAPIAVSLSNLYLRLERSAAGSRSDDPLVGVANAALWMTTVTLQGDTGDAVALTLVEDAQVFVGGTAPLLPPPCPSSPSPHPLITAPSPHPLQHVRCISPHHSLGCAGGLSQLFTPGELCVAVANLLASASQPAVCAGPQQLLKLPSVTGGTEIIQLSREIVPAAHLTHCQAICVIVLGHLRSGMLAQFSAIRRSHAALLSLNTGVGSSLLILIVALLEIRPKK